MSDPDDRADDAEDFEPDRDHADDGGYADDLEDPGDSADEDSGEGEVPAEPDAESGTADPSAGSDSDDDGLLSRLELIAERPLAERADALAQLHDELRTRLESDSPRASA